MIRFLALMIAGLAGAASAWAQTEACPGGPPGWIAAQGSGCRLWNACPQREETVTWSGACPNGVADGRGIKQWFRGGKPNDRFEGTLRDGKENGRGVFTRANGARYDGEWRDGQHNGRGVFTWANGNRYEGEFRNGKFDGRGVFTSTNGNRYDGEWRDSQPNGRGVFTSAGGNRYDGEYRDGSLNGRGVFTWANGDRYDGEWRDGRPNGSGTARIGNDSYSGTWSNGCFRQGDRRAWLIATEAECGFR
jgi:hypothetical protein